MSDYKKITINFVSSDFTYNKPSFMPSDAEYGKNYLFATKTINLDLLNTDYKYIHFNDFSYSGNIEYGSLHFEDLNGGTISSSDILEGDFLISEINENIFLGTNQSNEFFVIVNGYDSDKTEYLTIYVTVAAINVAPEISSVTFFYKCDNPLTKIPVGIHVYSAYDATAHRAKLKGYLYTYKQFDQLTAGDTVWGGPYGDFLAFPYFYGYYDKVIKVGGDLDRSRGNITSIKLRKTWGFNFNPSIEINEEYGYYRSTEIIHDNTYIGKISASCVIPSMSGSGIIREIIDINDIHKPYEYTYFIGSTMQSMLDPNDYDRYDYTKSNDLYFTEYNIYTDVFEPITGSMHALRKLGIASMYSQEDWLELYRSNSKGKIWKDIWNDLEIFGIILVIIIVITLLYELGSYIYTNLPFSTKLAIRRFFYKLKAAFTAADYYNKPGGPFNPWGWLVDKAADLINYIDGLFIQLESGVTKAFSKIPSLIIILIIVLLILTILSIIIARPREIAIQEDCPNFYIVYGDTPYIEVGTHLTVGWFDPDLYIMLAPFHILYDTYISDGIYFYKSIPKQMVANGVPYIAYEITEKFPAFCNNAMIDNIPPLAPTYEYRASILADDPIEVTEETKLKILPYISGKDEKTLCWDSINEVWVNPYLNIRIEETVVPVKCCDLDLCESKTFVIEAGEFKSCISQEDADQKAAEALSALVNHTLRYPLDKCLGEENVGIIDCYFTHEIKVETNPTITSLYYDARINLTPQIGMTLYYNYCGCTKVLNGYYAISGATTPFRTFYHTTNGTVDQILYMEFSYSTETTTAEPVIMDHLDYTSNWYLSDIRVQFLDDYVQQIRNDKYFDPNTLYTNSLLKKGFIKTPLTLEDFQLYDNFTTTNHSQAPCSWYTPLIGWIYENDFYYYCSKTIRLDIEQDCRYKDGQITTRGCYVIGKIGDTEVPIGSPVELLIQAYSGETLISSYSATTNPNTSRTYIVFNDLIGTGIEISNIIISAILSTNPMNNITYVIGNYLGCMCEMWLSFSTTETSATVTVNNGVPSYTYIWTNYQSTYNSLLNTNTATNLEAGKKYFVSVTDGNNCLATESINAGGSTFKFDTDYIVLTYKFISGNNLESRTRVVEPNIGQTSQSKYVGLELQTQWPDVDYIIKFGGNNTNGGFESVLIDLVALKTAYPTQNEIVVDCRAYWMEVADNTPIHISATLYRSGEMVENNFSFTNITAADSLNLDFNSKIISFTSLEPNTSGQRVGVLKYDFSTFIGSFNINDTTTPSV